MYVNIFRFCTSTFLTDDACEHVSMQLNETIHLGCRKHPVLAYIALKEPLDF